MPEPRVAPLRSLGVCAQLILRCDELAPPILGRRVWQRADAIGAVLCLQRFAQKVYDPSRRFDCADHVVRSPRSAVREPCARTLNDHTEPIERRPPVPPVPRIVAPGIEVLLEVVQALLDVVVTQPADALRDCVWDWFLGRR